MTAPGPYTLSEGIVQFIKEMKDPFVDRLPEEVGVFSSVTMRHVTGKRPALLFISDESFQKLAMKLETPEKINRLTVSHVIRMTEAYRMSSLLRANELLKSSIWNLNASQFVGAAPGVRALAELSAQNLEAANVVFHYLKGMSWDLFDNMVLGLCGEGGEGSLNDYVEKLFFGARRQEHLMAAHLQQTNIMTVLQRVSKKLKEKAGYDLLEKYEYVCELVHPNRAGFEFYVGAPERVDGYWERYPIAVGSVTARTAEVLSYLLWLLAFGVGTLLSVQSVYNDINLLVRQKAGVVYPRT